MIVGNSELWIGHAPGATAHITEPGEDNPQRIWSHLEITSVRVLTSGDVYKVWTSSDGGHSWTEQEVAHPVDLARAFDELYGVDGGIWKSVTAGATWSEIVAAPSDPEFIEKIVLSTTNLYASIHNGIDAAAVNCYGLDGSGMVEVFENGGLIGQVDEGVLAFEGGILDGAPVLRLVGSAPSAVTGLPDQFTGLTLNYHNNSAVACKGNTAILIAASLTTEVEGDDDGILYRSTDQGLTWTEVHTWKLGFSLKSGNLSVAYDGASEGVWWANAAVEGSTEGLWRSEDDGVTWALVVPTWEEIQNAPPIASAAMPSGASR
jgi:hypothetical protein